MRGNATQTEYPKARTVHAYFGLQATASPLAIAIQSDDGVLTYEELDRRATRLSGQLRHLGVRCGTLVGLCLERSPELIVGMLGILKAGGAYVPLDPVYPDDRLAFMLNDTGAPVVLIHQPTETRMRPLIEAAGAAALDMDDLADVRTEPLDNTNETSADDLAYVMYTSGSTGRPKGVLVPHRAVVRLVRDTDYCHFDAGEVFLQMAPLSFDASTFEIWGPLLNGGRLALMPSGPLALDQVGSAIRRFGVTTLWLTAGLFHLMVEQRAADLAELRQLVAGGDVLSPSHVQKALAAMPDGVVINGYGPTEGTTFSCCFRMSPDYRVPGSVPIGRPIANATAYVLDERGRPAPVGVAGELHVGGAGLARGYLNDPELTRQKFIADPFSTEPGARLYRTGDRCRFLADGNLEFLGRLDNQVKIMGHRIEPGEIEAILGQYSSVSQCAVIAQTSPRGDKQLVAYVIAIASNRATAAEFKSYLAARLPPYMVPSHFVFLSALPLTPNGKVDRAALPAPAEQDTSVAADADLLTDIELTVAAVWKRILHRAVGLDDNFFDVGGTSLKLIEAHSELQLGIGRDLSITEMFQYTTVRSLAERLGGRAAVDPMLAKAQDRGRRQKEAIARQRSLRRVAP